LIFLNTYASVRQPQVQQTLTINDWFRKIKNSEYSSTITQARNGLKDYNTTKFSLPCVTYNFTFDKYKKDDNISSNTGVLYIDIDNPLFELHMLDTSKVYAYYKSFGGHGYSIIIRIDGLTKDNFNYNYLHVCEQLSISEFIDANAIKATQFNVLSYDEDLFINEDCTVFQAETAPLTSVIRKKENIYTSEGGIRFNNLDEVDLMGGDYIVNWEGIEYVNCFIPMKKREAGNRNSFLLSYCNNLVYLNPNLVKEAVVTILGHVNQKACYPSVPKEKVFSVVESIFKYKEAGTLQPITFNKKRKFVFDKKLKLSKEEKFAIMNIELCNKKMNESQLKINDILMNWDFNLLGKITQRAVYNNNQMSKKTVEKYWPDFKEYIAYLNNDVSAKINEPSADAKSPQIEDKVGQMLNDIRCIDAESSLYISKRSLIEYIIDKHHTIGEEGVEYFYNQVFEKEVA
jgi:hypothetical protein